jgi:hypothetical protein
MFVILDDKYELKHSPKAKLEKYKETAWTLFNNLINSKHAAVIAAGFFPEAIEEAFSDIGKTHVFEMKHFVHWGMIFPCFPSTSLDAYITDFFMSTNTISTLG